MNKPKARNRNIVVQQMDGETLIYDLTSDKACCLNETSSNVWRLCDGTRTIGEIAVELSSKLNTRVSESLVEFAIDELEDNALMRTVRSSRKAPDGPSRRDVIRKIGFSSAVTLPIISSVVAPRTMNAQSCGNLFDACQGGLAETCCPGNSCVGYSAGMLGQCCFDDGSIPPDGPPRNPGTHCTRSVIFCVSQFCCSGNATVGDTNVACTTSGGFPGIPCICS